jgi:N-carbamoylputrescine amidase
MARAKNSDQVKVALVQMSCAQEPAANLTKAVQRIEAAAKRGAKIVCLQELFRSRYFCQSEDHRNFKLAEAIPGSSTEVLGDLAKRKQIVIVASLFERRAAGIYHNTAVVLDADGSLAGKYRKMHIPDDPLYYEKFYFTPGDLGSMVSRGGTGGGAQRCANYLLSNRHRLDSQ